MRSYLFIGNKKCRIYAACGVSQKPIYFIETEDKHVLIHTKDSSVKCYHCLKLLEDKLDTNFYRCHASFIVNLLHIDTYERLEIKLENNFHIPVSKHRKSGFTEKLLDFYARYME